MRRTLCIVSALVILVCAAACTGTQTPAATTSVFSAPAHVSRAIPSADRDALSSFFSRWSAYTLALGTGADDLGEVYTGLSRMADGWTNEAYCTSREGPTYVTLPFAASEGRLVLEVRDGAISNGTVEWNTEDDDEVSATLTTMVACNALVYGLCATADAAAAQNLYSQCVEDMSRDADGFLVGGPETLAGYIFTLRLDPETQGMAFRGDSGA